MRRVDLDGAPPRCERACGLDELLAADEAFLTSSLRGIAPLVRVGSSPIGRGVPGDMTRRMTANYLALVDHETALRQS